MSNFYYMRFAESVSRVTRLTNYQTKWACPPQICFRTTTQMRVSLRCDVAGLSAEEGESILLSIARSVREKSKMGLGRTLTVGADQTAYPFLPLPLCPSS
jgi:hypothetical protein